MATKRTRRTPEQMIKDLEAQIEKVKLQAERKRARKDPALRHIVGAVRSIDKAMEATGDAATRRALDEARATLSACLALNGPGGKKGALVPRRAAKPDPGAVVGFLKKQGAGSGEEISAAVGTDTGALRPVLKRLIADGAVKATGKGRGTRYAVR